MRCLRFALLALSVFVPSGVAQTPSAFDLTAIEFPRIVPAADLMLHEAPITVTAVSSPRSAGGPHDFFSEGDYWWPDPKNPDGPYIQRDGMTNPDNFVAHRQAMVRFSIHVGTLTSAYRLTGDERYARQAVVHLRAWFIEPATRMNPHLLYAQAIRGRFTGRGIGIIDTVHLVEVARATALLSRSRAMSAADHRAIVQWFADYLAWMTTHRHGIDERDAKNNHGTCWVMQVSAFAHLTGNGALLDDCRRRFKTILVPDQMAPDGSFPLELRRTKPYGYSIFNLDAFSTICQILSRPDDNLWTFTLPDGRGMAKGLAFLYPYLAQKSAWPFAKDVMYFDQWPVRQPSLLFGGLALGEPRYLDLWKSLDGSPAVDEIIRNLPIRHPLLWVPAPVGGRTGS
ncbi:MAG: alginate lyase family protein [Acidobacteria bacterium]|nr:alginate lyase family protein [Acidobacteriota bacterium]